MATITLRTITDGSQVGKAFRESVLRVFGIVSLTAAVSVTWQMLQSKAPPAPAHELGGPERSCSASDTKSRVCE